MLLATPLCCYATSYSSMLLEELLSSRDPGEELSARKRQSVAEPLRHGLNLYATS